MDLTTVVARQQAEIAQLRAELATLRLTAEPRVRLMMMMTRSFCWVLGVG